MVILKEVEIKNCFGLKHVILYFETNNQATIFNGSSCLGNELMYAVQSFFCKDELQCKDGCTPECQHGLGLIRIKFMCTIRTANSALVDAARLFSQSKVVLYYLDGKQYIDSIKVFHERCQLDVLLYSELSLDVFSTLMHYCNLDVYNRSLSELMADYLSVSKRWQTTKHQRVTKYMQISSLIDKELEITKKRVFVDVIKEIGDIFKYITWEEYSIHFTIPLVDKIVNVQDMNWDYMNLSRTETWVSKKGSENSCILSELEPGIKEIVKISQTIAIAKHLQKKCIFIKNINILEKFQNQELIKETIAKTIYTNLEANTTKKNFMWRIIDICNRFKLSIFILCSGKLPALPSNVNIIQSQRGDTNTDELINLRIE